MTVFVYDNSTIWEEMPLEEALELKYLGISIDIRVLIDDRWRMLVFTIPLSSQYEFEYLDYDAPGSMMNGPKYVNVILKPDTPASVSIRKIRIR